MPEPVSLEQSRYERAYNTLLPEIDEVPKERTIVINLDVPSVAIAMRGAHESAQAHRDALVTAFGLAFVEKLDRLPLYADALQYSHTLVLRASSIKIRDLDAEVLRVLKEFIEDAAPLARRGLLPKTLISDLRGETTREGRIDDVLVLIDALRKGWSQIAGLTPLTLDELHHAEHVVEEIVARAGDREDGRDVEAAKAVRGRAYSLAVREYAELRRSIVWLRWFEGDADDIAPSLWSLRARGKRSEQDTPSAELVKPATDTTTTSSPTAGGPTETTPVRPGMPGGSPFST